MSTQIASAFEGSSLKSLLNDRIKCTIIDCNSTFSNFASFKRHYNYFHNTLTKDILTLKCKFDNCDKKFASKRSLNDHIRLDHKGTITPTIKCSKCPKVFLYPSKLEAHCKKAHKTYKCDHQDCMSSDISFEKWSLLLQHKASNHPLKCPKCPLKTFKTSQGLKKHTKLKHFSIPKSTTHTHICAVCAQSFKRPSDLKLHVDTKHNLKRFYCLDSECKSSYQSKQRLKAHLDKMHPNLSYTDNEIKLS